MDRQSGFILLQQKNTWSLWIVWILFYNHCTRNTTEHLSRGQAILGQLIVSML